MGHQPIFNAIFIIVIFRWTQWDESRMKRKESCLEVGESGPSSLSKSDSPPRLKRNLKFKSGPTDIWKGTCFVYRPVKLRQWTPIIIITYIMYGEGSFYVMTHSHNQFLKIWKKFMWWKHIYHCQWRGSQITQKRRKNEKKIMWWKHIYPCQVRGFQITQKRRKNKNEKK